MLIYKPSEIAASALFLATRIMYRDLGKWSDTMACYSTYTEQQLRPCFKDMCILFTGIERCSLQTVRKKFCLARFNKVALIRISL